MAAKTTVAEAGVKVKFNVDEKSAKNAQNQAKQLRAGMQKILGIVGVTVSIAGLIKFTKDAISAGKEVEQLNRKFSNAFGEMTEETDKWADNFADSVRLSKSTVKEYLMDNEKML